MQETEALQTPVCARQQAGGRLWWWLLLGLLLIMVPVLSPVYVVQATETMMFILLAVSINLLTGYTGMTSLGHAAFFALGGYGAGLLAKFAHVSFPVALVAAPLLAALAAVAIGFFCIRLTRVYFIMLTLAFGQLIYTVVWKWRSVTGGDDGLIRITPPAWLQNANVYYYFTVVLVMVCLVAIYRFCQSPFGATLKAIQDNPNRAASIGIHVRRFQLVVFVMASFFAGIAGALYVFHHRGIFPQQASWVSSASLMLMAVFGGVSYFSGPIVGAVIITLLGFFIPRITDYWLFFLGLIVLLVAFFMPNGLVDVFHRLRARLQGGTGL